MPRKRKGGRWGHPGRLLIAEGGPHPRPCATPAWDSSHPRGSPEIPSRRGSRKTQPAGPMFLSSEPALPAFWTQAPRARPAPGWGGGRGGRGAGPASPPGWILGFAPSCPLVLTLASPDTEGCSCRTQGAELGPEAPPGVRAEQGAWASCLWGEGGPLGEGAGRSRAHTVQRPRCGPRPGSQARSATSQGLALVAPIFSPAPRPRVTVPGRSLSLGREGLCRGLPQVLGLENGYGTDRRRYKRGNKPVS